MVHYQDTILNKVDQDRIFKFIDQNLQNRLRNIFGNKSIAVWGSQGGPGNRSRFEKMKPGDDVMIVEGDNIKLLGKIADITKNIDLSNELWKSLGEAQSDPWELIYFIANPLEINLPFSEFKKLFDYSENWSLRGLTNVSDEKLEFFYNQYDDLYSILQRLKEGEKIEKRKEDVEETVAEDVIADSEEELEDEKVVTDHVRMQWKLLQLGLKAGGKVWIPRNDQTKIRNQYDYNDFENEFASGIDTPGKYVENIDVVWKEEFRIDAAFEVENSTSIYSGLLRFSDLKIVAPNSTYPLFIVAPQSKKNRVYEQVIRPTFKKMDFDRKVRFLSYEAVDEVDKFFEKSSTGLNAEMLFGKSENLS